MDADGPLVIVHVPKTAGTSFRHALIHELGADALALDYGPKAIETTPLVRRFVYEQPDLPRLRAEMIAAGQKILCGHVPAARYADVFGRRNLLVIVRDPIQRLVSEFLHFQRHHGETRGFRECVRDPSFIDHQVRLAGAVAPADYGFVGVTEQYAETVALANRQYGWNLPVIQVNLGRPTLSTAYRLEPPLEAEVAELNRLDLEYYRAAVAEFERRR
jgi:hypothetical protein